MAKKYFSCSNLYKKEFVIYSKYKVTFYFSTFSVGLIYISIHTTSVNACKLSFE